MPAGAVIMFRPFRFSGVALAALALMSFTMPPERKGRAGAPVYDVRGAFVAARGDTSHRLIQEIHHHIAASIDRTMRPTVNPRVVLTVRLDEVVRLPVFFSTWYSAKVNVKAASVVNGEVIAMADFASSVFSFGGNGMADDMLAAEIAAKIAKEFRLDAPPAATLATALFP